ncbi:ROK family protein [Sphingomonas japonica]|uniref:ROK family protein n=1 Tax=Sphingomonas japonica TaxID=511662 RepID=UPI00111DE6C1|nr:ROK family protein [Sphingomonas japonica]
MTVTDSIPSAADRYRNNGTGLIAGVELGGTKCVCVLATIEGESIEQVTVPTSSPEATLAAIDAVLDRWWRATGFDAMGIASFGPLDLDPRSATYGYVTATSKPNWSHSDVGMRLSRRFGVPMAFDTDVNGAAIAERTWGAARGIDDFAYITLGTGVGVGLIVHGKPTRGFGHCELGHIRVPRLAGDDWPGSCPFHAACVEGLASGTAIKARLGSEHVGSIAQDAPIWDSVVDALAQLCQVLAMGVGACRILIGGGVANGQPHLLPRIEARMRDNIAGYVNVPAGPYVVAPELGGQAGPLGPIAMAIALLETNAVAE